MELPIRMLLTTARKTPAKSRYTCSMPDHALLPVLWYQFLYHLALTSTQAMAGCCTGVSITVSTSIFGIVAPVPARFVVAALGFLV